MKVLDVIVTILMVIGGLNWGVVGFADYNVINAIFGEASVISRLIYALVGLSALYEIGSFAFGLDELQHRWCETPATAKH